ncbi:MAG: hypothetical protein PVH62_00225 [Anaerolineae bacterium]
MTIWTFWAAAGAGCGPASNSIGTVARRLASVAAERPAISASLDHDPTHDVACRRGVAGTRIGSGFLFVCRLARPAASGSEEGLTQPWDGYDGYYCSNQQQS